MSWSCYPLQDGMAEEEDMVVSQILDELGIAQTGGMADAPSQAGDGSVRHGSQSSSIALAKPAHTGGQKAFLVHGLVCPTALEPGGAISTDQQ